MPILAVVADTSSKETAMLAAVVHGFHEPLVLEDVPIPEPGAGQVVLKTETSGLCHTDVHAAHGAVERLVAERGPVMFFQSGGCCDGSLPLCFALGEIRVGEHDVRLGEVGGCPFYVDLRHFGLWEHAQLVLDVAAGAPEGFSLPAGDDAHFVAGARPFTAEEEAFLAPRGSPHAGGRTGEGR